MFRRKAIVTAYTHDPNHYEFYKLRKATSNIPNWFKDTASEYELDVNGIRMPVPTIKRCPAVISTLSKGVLIPCQTDVIIESTEGNPRWVTPNASAAERIKEFSIQQKGAYDVGHIKIDSSWILEETTGIDFVLTDAYYSNFNAPWRIATGVLDFKYQHCLNINIAMPRDTPQFTIHANTPLAILYPMTEKQVEFEHKLVSKDEWDTLRNKYASRNVFLSKYSKHKKLMTKPTWWNR